MKFAGKDCVKLYKTNGNKNKERKRKKGGDMVEWLKRRTSNLRIASRMGSNSVRDKPLFP